MLTLKSEFSEIPQYISKPEEKKDITIQGFKELINKYGEDGIIDSEEIRALTKNINSVEGVTKKQLQELLDSVINPFQGLPNKVSFSEEDYNNILKIGGPKDKNIPIDVSNVQSDEALDESRDINKELRKAKADIIFSQRDLNVSKNNLSKLEKSFNTQKSNLLKKIKEKVFLEKEYNEASGIEKSKLLSKLNLVNASLQDMDSSMKDLYKKVEQSKNDVTNIKKRLKDLKQKKAPTEKATEATKITKAEKLAAEKLVADKLAAEKLVADKVAAEKLVADKLAAEKLVADKAAAEKLAAEKLLADKLAAEKLAAEKLAAEKKKKLEDTIDPLFKGEKIDDATFSPNTRKNYKVSHTGGEQSKTNPINTGKDKNGMPITREMTNDEIKMYNTYVDKWNKVRGLAQLAPNPEPSLWDKASDFFSSNEEGSKKVEKRGHFTRFLVPIGTIHPGSKLENRMNITRRNNKGENISLTNAQIIAENKRNGYEGDTIDKQIKSYNEQKGKKDTGEIDIKQKDSIEKTTVLSQNIKDKILKKTGLSSLTEKNISKKLQSKTIRNTRYRITEGNSSRSYNNIEQEYYKKAVAIYNEVTQGNKNGVPLTLKEVKDKIDKIK